MAAPLSQQLINLLAANNVPSSFTSWLQSNGLCSVEDFVWAAANNPQKVDDELIGASQIRFSIS